MSMVFLEWNCPSCGAGNKEDTNTWAYGSPIRYCKSCNSEFHDKRWREVAIEGYDPKSTNSTLYLKLSLAFLALAVVMSLVVFISIKTTGRYNIRSAGLVFLGILGFVLFMVLYLRIKLGFEAKSQEKYMTESLERMKDRGYVEKLRAYGYDIPDDIGK